VVGLITNQRHERIIYGEINDPKIEQVKVKNNRLEFVDTNIISKGDKRIYYIIGEFNDIGVRGLSKDNEIIDQQG
jgi:hypothetical protein